MITTAIFTVIIIAILINIYTNYRKPKVTNMNMLSKARWAVVGDVMNQSKPASRVVDKLRGNGKEVFLINSRDERCLPSLLDIPDSPVDVVNLIVNPKVGINIIDDMVTKNIQYLWIQPGAGTPEIVSKAEANNIEVHQGCVLIES